MNALTNRGTLKTEDVNSRPSERRYAALPVIVSAATVALSDLVLTAPESEALAVSGLTVSNPDASAVEVSFAINEVGETPLSSDIVISDLSIPANGTYDLGGFLFINPSKELRVFASAAVDLRVFSWVTAYR